MKMSGMFLASMVSLTGTAATAMTSGIPDNAKVCVLTFESMDIGNYTNFSCDGGAEASLTKVSADGGGIQERSGQILKFTQKGYQLSGCVTEGAFYTCLFTK